MSATDQSLHIADSLALPVEAVVETFAVLGKRGSGKTSTAVVMAEEMIGAGHPAVVIDPVGVWWGLRSSQDGKGTGLPVVIFGGDHADVPLMEKAGEVIADAVIEGRFPAILDLSHLSKGAMRRFLADFLERLYHRNREPLHLFVDEADLLAPQRLPAEGLRLFGAMDDIQRRGRARGLGTTLITQRPAVINKDLLSQAEVLIALRLTGARDVAAIDEWVRLNADEAEASTVKASLASLAVGTAWIWSPSLLGVLSKVDVRRRSTFDSSATPKPGQPRPVAEAFAAVDTAALGAQIEELAQEAAAADPAALKAKIARLEKELEQARAASPAQVVEKEVVVEVPVEVPVEVRVPVLEAADVSRFEAAAKSVLSKLASLDGAG
ncbi:MAG: ATP-binding protein, partial [Actinomycetes bacterium]